ncbi:MAG: EamA family transporter [Acidobacteria bacterium]|nr:EamA family transporter [Acidobacteriota bacterium]
MIISREQAVISHCIGHNDHNQLNLKTRRWIQLKDGEKHATAELREVAASSRSALRGYLYIAAATFLWGIAATLGRAVFTGRLLAGDEALRSIEPVILSQTRVTFSFLLLLPLLVWRTGAARLRLPRADLGRLFILGTLGTAASNYFYYLAIQRTNVATAIILQYTAPIWVLFYFVARGRHRALLQQFSAVALAVAGCAMVLNVFGAGGFRADALGLAAATLSALAFAFYNVYGHDLLRRYNRWIIVLYSTLGASLFWMVVNPVWKVASANYSGAQWLFLLVFAMISALAPFSLYAAGLQHLPPTRAIVVSCLEPVFAIVIAAIALGEVIRPLQAAGIVLVLTATLVVQMPEPKEVVEPIE